MLRKNITRLLLLFGLVFSIATFAATLPVNQLFHHAGDPVVGNPNGKITIVEFFDYQCSHCVNMADTLAAIVKQNPSVRIVYKEFPIRGDLSVTAARAALSANKQGKYYALHHALLTAKEPLFNQRILELAQGAGLNIKRLKKDMQSKAITRQLEDNQALGESLGVNGTPAFFIGPTQGATSENVQFTFGEMSQHEIQQAIDQIKTGK